MLCTCPNCGHQFETPKRRRATPKPKRGDARKPWQKNTPEHKWRNPWSTKWCMLAETQRKHDAADRRGLGRITPHTSTAYADALGVSVNRAEAIMAHHSRILEGFPK